MILEKPNLTPTVRENKGFAGQLPFVQDAGLWGESLSRPRSSDDGGGQPGGLPVPAACQALRVQVTGGGCLSLARQSLIRATGGRPGLWGAWLCPHRHRPARPRKQQIPGLEGTLPLGSQGSASHGNCAPERGARCSGSLGARRSLLQAFLRSPECS